MTFFCFRKLSLLAFVFCVPFFVATAMAASGPSMEECWGSLLKLSHRRRFLPPGHHYLKPSNPPPAVVILTKEQRVRWNNLTRRLQGMTPASEPLLSIRELGLTISRKNTQVAVHLLIADFLRELALERIHLASLRESSQPELAAALRELAVALLLEERHFLVKASKIIGNQNDQGYDLLHEPSDKPLVENMKLLADLAEIPYLDKLIQTAPDSWHSGIVFVGKGGDKRTGVFSAIRNRGPHGPAFFSYSPQLLRIREAGGVMSMGEIDDALAYQISTSHHFVRGFKLGREELHETRHFNFKTLEHNNVYSPYLGTSKVRSRDEQLPVKAAHTKSSGIGAYQHFQSDEEAYNYARGLQNQITKLRTYKARGETSNMMGEINQLVADASEGAQTSLRSLLIAKTIEEHLGDAKLFIYDRNFHSGSYELPDRDEPVSTIVDNVLGLLFPSDLDIFLGVKLTPTNSLAFHLNVVVPASAIFSDINVRLARPQSLMFFHGTFDYTLPLGELGDEVLLRQLHERCLSNTPFSDTERTQLAILIEDARSIFRHKKAVFAQIEVETAIIRDLGIRYQQNPTIENYEAVEIALKDMKIAPMRTPEPWKENVPMLVSTGTNQ